MASLLHARPALSQKASLRSLRLQLGGQEAFPRYLDVCRAFRDAVELAG